MLHELRACGFLEGGARAIAINIPLYNVDQDIFGIYRFLVEFMETGYVWKFENYYFIDAKEYLANGNYVPIFLQAFMLMFITFYVGDMCYQLHSSVTHGLTWKYFRDMWNWVEIMNNSVFVAVIYFRLKFYSSEVLNAASGDYLIEEEYINIELCGYQYDMELGLVAFNILVSFLKVFKYLKPFPRFYMPWATVGRAFPDLLCFLFLFLGCMTSFIIVGNLTFGKQMRAFRTFNSGIKTMILFLLGDFSYDEMPHINKVIAPIFFYGYIILMVLIMFNMATAILLDAYSAEKEDMLVVPPSTLFSNLRENLRNVLWPSWGSAFKSVAKPGKKVVWWFGGEDSGGTSQTNAQGRDKLHSSSANLSAVINRKLSKTASKTSKNTDFAHPMLRQNQSFIPVKPTGRSREGSQVTNVNPLFSHEIKEEEAKLEDQRGP